MATLSHRPSPALLASMAIAAACGSFDPYAGGGAWLTPALDQGFEASCDLPDSTRVGPNIGDLFRDFSLYDQFAYRVNLHDFCEHTVLITVGVLGDEDDEEALFDVIDQSRARLPSARSASPLIAMTAWYRTTTGEIPTIEDLRQRAPDLGLDEQVPRIGSIPVILLQDAQRFPNAASAAAAQWIATDIEGELNTRLQVDREIAGRWPMRSTPFFVVLHPGLQIATCGTDPEEHQILQAIHEGPDLFVFRADNDESVTTQCSRRFN
ncbi:MAG: hypothetical protein EA397_07175 [Deltaproteobacteria bacterium]|nr:MAG: hypothetical protein EA397_07175 [Deltaproteobacteria bacterium]